MKKVGWGIFSMTVVLAVLGTGMATARAQHTTTSPFGAPYHTPTADGRGEFPIGGDHHVGQFGFSVLLGRSGPEGSFEFNELNGQRRVVEHLLLRPIDRLTIAGHTAQMEGAVIWHNRRARVRVIVTDDGEHHDSISIRVAAVEGADAGKALYEAGGFLTSGAIHVVP